MKLTFENARARSVMRLKLMTLAALLLTSVAAGEPAATQPTDELVLDTPRSTVRSFLLAMQEKQLDEAANCLDLQAIDESKRQKRGRELAGLLFELIKLRMPNQKLEIIPDEEDYTNPDFPARGHFFALTTATDEQGNETPEIALARGDDGRWRFSQTTVEAIPDLYKPLTTQQAPPAQTKPDAAESASAESSDEASDSAVPAGLSSPRATLQTFYEAMKAADRDPDRIDEAVKCLDFSDEDVNLQDGLASERAKMLFGLIQTELGTPLYQEIPSSPDGTSYDLLGDDRIIIQQIEDGRWLFSSQTVERVPEMVRELSESGEQMNLSRELRFKLWLEQQMPSSLRGELLGVKYWHWLAMLVLIALGVVLDQVVLSIVHKMADSIARQRDLKLDRDVRRASLRPIGFLAMGLLWWYGLDLLSFSFSTKAYVILSAAVKIVVGAAGIWAIYRLIDLLGGYLAAAAQKTESRYDDLLVPLLRKTLKIGVTVIGFVYVAEVFQLPVKTLLTSLGIGGLAIGFAAREVLQNFFGSITVLLDRPFHIGDWIRTGDVEGTVEGVGFRSTRVRTFYNSLITVPNGALLTAKVDNLGARRYRRISTKLSLTYDTPPEKIDAFCEGIREIIRQHPYTRKDYYHVYFNEFDDASLNVLLYCFHEAPDWGTELRERHRLFSDILRLAKQLEVEFAFPTQTIHLFQEAKDEGSQDKPLPSDPGKVGREKAGEIIKKGGLHGAVPPPVSFDPLQSRATQTIGGTGDEETG